MSKMMMAVLVLATMMVIGCGEGKAPVAPQLPVAVTDTTPPVFTATQIVKTATDIVVTVESNEDLKEFSAGIEYPTELRRHYDVKYWSQLERIPRVVTLVFDSMDFKPGRQYVLNYEGIDMAGNRSGGTFVMETASAPVVEVTDWEVANVQIESLTSTFAKLSLTTAEDVKVQLFLVENQSTTMYMPFVDPQRDETWVHNNYKLIFGTVSGVYYEAIVFVTKVSDGTVKRFDMSFTAPKREMIATVTKPATSTSVEISWEIVTTRQISNVYAYCSWGYDTGSTSSVRNEQDSTMLTGTLVVENLVPGKRYWCALRGMDVETGRWVAAEDIVVETPSSE